MERRESNKQLEYDRKNATYTKLWRVLSKTQRILG